jgi:hypothetical protein
MGSWLGRGLGPRDWSCARRERWDRRSFRAAREGGKVSTFLCSLRLSPAAALVAATANAISATATIAAPSTAPTELLEGFGRKGINRGVQEGQAPRLAGSASGGKSGEGGLSTEPFTGS